MCVCEKEKSNYLYTKEMRHTRYRSIRQKFEQRVLERDSQALDCTVMWIRYKQKGK